MTGRDFSPLIIPLASERVHILLYLASSNYMISFYSGGKAQILCAVACWSVNRFFMFSTVRSHAWRQTNTSGQVSNDHPLTLSSVLPLHNMSADDYGYEEEWQQSDQPQHQPAPASQNAGDQMTTAGGGQLEQSSGAAPVESTEVSYAEAPQQDYIQYAEEQQQPPQQQQPLQQQQFDPSDSIGRNGRAPNPSYIPTSLAASQFTAPIAAAPAASVLASSLASAPVDPRATADYQVAWELELWRRTEVKAQMERWKVEEAARMRILEEEFAKAMKAEEAKLQVRLLKVAQAEKQAQAGMLELEKARASLRMQQNELASRVASLDKELAKHKGDADALVARMKDQTAYEVGKARAQMKDVQAQMELTRKELRSAQAKLSEAREEHEKDKLKHAKSNFGAVEQQLRKKEDELERMTQKWREALEERDHEKTRLAQALGKGMHLYKQLEDLKAEQLEAKHRDADFLRQQYLAKERQAGANRSVAEAHDIRAQVKAHLQAMSGPARTNVTDLPVHQPAALAQSLGRMSIPPVHSTAHPSFNTFQTQTAPSLQPQSQFGITATYPTPSSSFAARANSVPEPYNYLVHEQEVLHKIRSEGR